MGSTATSTSEVGPGTVIGDTYRIERVIGQGGMGVVFEAQHLRVPRRVAIKLLREQPDPDLLARFRQEAEVTSRLRHDGIVDVMDFNTLPSGASYIVMELLDGEALESRMANGPMPVDEALAIIRQIAAALHAAHCAGVVHRDMKPANVFLTKRERDGVLVDHVTLLDFGISKVHGSSVVRTNEQVVLGTPRYMAPEQALGRNEDVDPRADQFALAVIAYEMLAGTPPFEGSNATHVMFQIAYEQPVPLATRRTDLPTSIIATLERAMSKQPSARFADLSAFVEALTGRPLAQTDRSRYPVLSAARLPEAVDRSAETVDSRPRVRDSGTPTAAPAAEEKATVADRPRPRTKPANHRALLAGVVGSLVVGGVIVGVIATMKKDDNRVQPVAQVQHDAAPRLVDIDGAVAHHEPPVDAAVTAVDAAFDAGTAERREPPRAPTAPRVAPPMDDDLKDALVALKARNWTEASLAARRSLRTKPTARAYEVLVEVSCAQRDLAAAHSWMRSLPTSSWPRLKARCKAHDFELTSP